MWIDSRSQDILTTNHSQRRIYGQFFTPEPVVAACFALVCGELSDTPQIVDPACGDGAFLRHAVALGIGSPAALHGCDIDPQLVATLSAEGFAVRQADGLHPESLAAGQFDLVIGNPPFGIATPRDGHVLSSEARFLLRAIELVRPGGLVAMILPNGLLSNERLQELRRTLLQQTTLLALIELPRATFRGMGTSAACSILTLRAAAPPPQHLVFYGFAKTLTDLPGLITAYRQPMPAEASPEHCWVQQGSALARRMDAHYWRPQFFQIAQALDAYPQQMTLGELLGEDGLIAGDHVRPSLGEQRGAGLPYEYYQTREFLPTGYNTAALEHCNEAAYRRLEGSAVQQHDILVSCAGIGGAGKGRTCLITHQPGPSCTGDVLIVRSRRFDPVALWLLLSSRIGKMQLLRLQNGVGTVNLSTSELLQVRIPLLAEAEQQALRQRHAPIAATHERAIAAFRLGDCGTFTRLRNEAERLLGLLHHEIELMILGEIAA